jgi:hypothetical protein
MSQTLTFVSSLPEATNSPKGWNAVDVTDARCPLRERDIRASAKSYVFSEPPDEPLTKLFSLGSKVTEVTADWFPVIDARGEVRRLMRQRLIFLSSPPVAIVALESGPIARVRI